MNDRRERRLRTSIHVRYFAGIMSAPHSALNTRYAATRYASCMSAGHIDWTTVTSPAIAGSLAGLFGDALHHTRLAAISPLTAETLAGLGHTAHAIAQTYTSAGIVGAILAADNHKS